MDISTLQIAMSVLNGLLQGLTTLLGLFLSLQFLLFQISPYYSQNIHRNNLLRTLGIFLFTLTILIIVSILPLSNTSGDTIYIAIILSFTPFVLTIIFFIKFNKFLDVSQIHKNIIKKYKWTPVPVQTEASNEGEKDISTLVDIAIYYLDNNDFCMFKNVYDNIIRILMKYKENINRDIITHLIRLSAHILFNGYWESIEEISLVLIQPITHKKNKEGINNKITEVIRYQIEITKLSLKINQEVVRSYLKRINLLYKVAQNNKVKIPVEIFVDTVDLYSLLAISTEKHLYIGYLKELFSEIITPDDIDTMSLHMSTREDRELIKLKLEYFKYAIPLQKEEKEKIQRNIDKVIDNLRKPSNSPALIL